ncbi:MAG: hypothetical protein RLZZ450_5303, partial [Pseudomonadota bacterium]
MTTALSPVTLTRLEKAAVDNGFDQELPRDGDWLGFASTQCPLRVWLGSFFRTSHFWSLLKGQSCRRGSASSMSYGCCERWSSLRRPA